jgi:hypothetical protein
VMRRAGKHAREETPNPKTMHVQTDAWDPVTVVGAIEKHRTSQDWDGA